jgi:hypothetical protein
MKQKRQRNRIGTAGQRHEQSSMLGNQPLVPDQVSEAVRQQCAN